MITAKILINKISAALMILITVLLLVFFGAYAFAPEATNGFVQDMPEWLGNIFGALTADEGEVALSIGAFFENVGIPSYSFRVAGSDTPVLVVNLAVIIIFVVLLIASNFIKPLSLITTLAADVAAGVTAIGIIDGYNRVVASGVSTWSAASSCFLPIFTLLAVLFFSGCDQWIDVFAGLDERRHISEYFSYSLAFIVIAVVVALVLAILSWLIMGFGWAGFVFVSFFLICVLSIILEAIILFHVSYV